MTESQMKASRRFCCKVARREARNFYISFLLLPPERRRSMCALYAFMRRTDDIADSPGPEAGRRAALDAWRIELDDALDGRIPAGSWPGMPALAETVHRHAIPGSLFHDVIDGVAMDLDPQPFANFDDLRGYCYRVASAVGLCCLHIWGYQSDGGRAESMADSCGVALQLTNIIRDVREDALNGRVYLPTAEMIRFGVTLDELKAASPSANLRDLLEFQANRAYEFYRAAEPLIELVDPVGRPVLASISGIYRSLLDEIVTRDYDVISSRVSIPAWRKAWIATRSLSARFISHASIPTEAPRC
ncbi:phytoene/squalene synthase family protein [Isosphaeraceae bacterium EP7]